MQSGAWSYYEPVPGDYLIQRYLISLLQFPQRQTQTFGELSDVKIVKIHKQNSLVLPVIFYF